MSDRICFIANQPWYATNGLWPLHEASSSLIHYCTPASVTYGQRYRNILVHPSAFIDSRRGSDDYRTHVKHQIETVFRTRLGSPEGRIIYL